jgi:hypothetical protein
MGCDVGNNYSGFDDLLPEVYASCPGIPEASAQVYLRQAIIRFCERTHWLQREATIGLQCGVKDYPLPSVSCERIIEVSDVLHHQIPLRPFRQKEFPNHYWNHHGYTVEAMETPDVSIVLGCEPDCDDPCGLLVKWYAAPRRDACTFDSRLIEEFGEALVYGAIARVYLLPGEKFSNPKIANEYQVLFEQAMNRAKIRRFKCQSTGTMIFKSERFL